MTSSPNLAEESVHSSSAKPIQRQKSTNTKLQESAQNDRNRLSKMLDYFKRDSSVYDSNYDDVDDDELDDADDLIINKRDSGYLPNLSSSGRLSTNISDFDQSQPLPPLPPSKYQRKSADEKLLPPQIPSPKLQTVPITANSNIYPQELANSTSSVASEIKKSLIRSDSSSPLSYHTAENEDSSLENRKSAISDYTPSIHEVNTLAYIDQPPIEESPELEQNLRPSVVMVSRSSSNLIKKPVSPGSDGPSPKKSITSQQSIDEFKQLISENQPSQSNLDINPVLPVPLAAQPVQSVTKSVKSTTQPVQSTNQPIESTSKTVESAAQTVAPAAQIVASAAQTVASSSEPVKAVAQKVTPVTKQVQSATQAVTSTGPVPPAIPSTRPSTKSTKPVQSSAQLSLQDQPVHSANEINTEPSDQYIIIREPKRGPSTNTTPDVSASDINVGSSSKDIIPSVASTFEKEEAIRSGLASAPPLETKKVSPSTIKGLSPTETKFPIQEPKVNKNIQNEVKPIVDSDIKEAMESEVVKPVESDLDEFHQKAQASIISSTYTSSGSSKLTSSTGSGKETQFNTSAPDLEQKGISTIHERKDSNESFTFDIGPLQTKKEDQIPQVSERVSTTDLNVSIPSRSPNRPISAASIGRSNLTRHDILGRKSRSVDLRHSSDILADLESVITQPLVKRPSSTEDELIRTIRASRDPTINTSSSAASLIGSHQRSSSSHSQISIKNPRPLPPPPLPRHSASASFSSLNAIEDHADDDDGFVTEEDEAVKPEAMKELPKEPTTKDATATTDSKKQKKHKKKHSKEKRRSVRNSSVFPSSGHFNHDTLLQLLQVTEGTIIGEEFQNIGLESTDKQLLERLVDSLSRLTADMIIDSERHDESVKRLNKAIKALEGF